MYIFTSIYYLYRYASPRRKPLEDHFRKNIYDNPWIGLTEYQVINPSGNPGHLW